MRENLVQLGSRGNDGWTHIDYDWYSRGIPPNVECADQVYLDTSYGFAAFNSQKEKAMTIQKGTGCYDRATFITGDNGDIKIGKYTILNGTTIISNYRVKIGNHCMLAWGSVISDSWISGFWANKEVRENLLKKIAHSPKRTFPIMNKENEVVLKDNCWIGFDSVVLPGVTIGRSAIVGSKSVVNESVPDYAVVVGNPARVIKYLSPDDGPETYQELLRECGLEQ